jgi:hypothetical protein
MIKGKYYFIILGIVLISAILLRITAFFSDKSEKVVKQPESVESFVLEGDSKPEPIVTTTPTIIEAEKKPEVIINTPLENEVVSSPLVVSGQARGSWFFEGSLPVKVLDEAGNILAIAPATAETDWMTSEFVPFKALLNFTSTSSVGSLVIAKDNPSGLAEFDKSVSIPLRFLTK